MGLSRTQRCRMTWTWLTAAAYAAAVGTAAADTRLHVSPDGGVRIDSVVPASAPNVAVEWYDDTGLEVGVTLDGLDLLRDVAGGGQFLDVTCPGTPVAGDTGTPALPVVRRLIGVPPGATVQLNVDTGTAWDVDLASLGLNEYVRPVQGPASLNPEGLEVAFGEIYDTGARLLSTLVFEEAAYGTDASLPEERVTITEIGISRGVRLHLLEVWPVAYNPVRGTLTIWPHIGVQVRFLGGEPLPLYPHPSSGINRVLLNPPQAPASRGDMGDNYLIITAQVFAGSDPLTEFITAKTAQGFNVTTYTALPGQSKVDIKNYIDSLWNTPDAPDYVLIIGDANDTTYAVAADTIPVQIGGGTKYARTDIPYVCMDGGDDWFPDIAVGRIPVRLVSDLQNVVDKILSVEAADFADPTYCSRASFLSGPDPYADGDTRHDNNIDAYITPNNITPIRLYTSQGADTQDVKDAFNYGTFLSVYFGHSAGMQAWSAPAMTFADIEELTNYHLYPYLISFSCSSSAFHWMDEGMSPGFLEKFLRVADKGVAGGYGTAANLGVYDFTTWGTLYDCLMQATYADDIREVGPAAQAAAGHFVEFYGAADPVSRDYTELFFVLGDPSMRLPEPPQVNYLIITAEEYEYCNALRDFVAHKRERGFNTMVYTVASGTSNTDIKTYIQSLWGTADQPDYVLLVGDTAGSTATVNTIPNFTGVGDKYAPTDWPYVCMGSGDDWYPEIPIGRFSVRDATTLADVVEKTIFVEEGNFTDPDYVTRGAFLANADTNGQAEPTHDWVIDTLLTPNDYTGIKLYASAGAGTQDVADAVNSGCMFTFYFGHSSSSGWWSPAFDTSDVSALTNEGMYCVAGGWSCNSADYTSDECYGEAWLRARKKGGVAYISAADYIYWGSVEDWAPSVSLEKNFFSSIFDDGNWTLGDAWVAGLYGFLKEHGGWDGDPNHAPTQNYQHCRNFFEEFVILGDPSLELPRADGFTMTPTPEARDLCSPPDDQAAYTIDVGLLGDFAEQVTVSAVGLPSGATVAFDVNGQVPPFTTTMTVGNLSASPAGQYTIVVDGTAISKRRSTTVSLSISTSIAAAPTLTEPSNGATGVARGPVFTWVEQADAQSYDLELATDSDFGDIVYSVTVNSASHEAEIYLDSLTEYFWRVQASNGCGVSNYSDMFSFTTLSQADYFTEEFDGGGDSVDLDNYTLELYPNGSGSFYEMCGCAATELPTDPAGGITLNLSDDGSQYVNPSLSVFLYGMQYAGFYVNANGNITFSSTDGTWNESLSEHFDQPRIAALFDDFDPTSGGTISWKVTTDHVAVTWYDVPEYNTSDSNTFQIEMFTNGDIHITWLGIDSSDAIVGLSAGDGIPGDYLEMDLSTSGPCDEPGACCRQETCSILIGDECLAAGGVFHGEGTTCEPNPCVPYESSCVIISEVVEGALSGRCPKWIEITNTGDDSFAFIEGGIIVQMEQSADVSVDVDLSGLVIPAGQSLIVCSNHGGVCTGGFPIVYGFDADVYTDALFGDGNDRYILTDTADGSHLLDIYGAFGTDGTGHEWEYGEGYAHRRSSWMSGTGQDFAAGQWVIGGAGSLAGSNPTQLLLDETTPGMHAYDWTCVGPITPGDHDDDGDVDADDCALFYGCLTGPCGQPLCDPALHGGDPACSCSDFNFDGDLDLSDFAELQPRCKE
ncbi:MAG: hypothetical protein JXO22_04410 [Phycisphaerae bacterium]|nr:hypothetical protein [Phycisphaerae bacterium]